MIVVGRNIGGVSVNPFEWLLNGDGDIMKFTDEESAKNYLRECGYTEDEIYFMVFEEVEE